MEIKRFTLDKGPILRKADFKSYGTKNMMIDVMIALCPLIIFAWIKNGLIPFISGTDVSVWDMLKPLVFVICGGLFSFSIELGYFAITKKEKNFMKNVSDSLKSYSIIPGLMLAMILPLNTPIWILLLGCLFGVIVGKMLFGGFGYNIFNPALVGYIFVMTAYYGVISRNGGYLNPSEAVDIITGATPLADFRNVITGAIDLDQLFNTHGSIWSFFLGTNSGSIAETSSILCIVALVYLLIRKTINWRIPVVYLGTIFSITYIIGCFYGYALDIRYPLFNLFSGGVMFGAVFMATEPVTSPRTPNGKIIYALFLAMVTILLRYLSDLPEGVCTSILFMNMFTPIIDDKTSKLRVEEVLKKKILKYSVVGISLFLIVGFMILKINASYNAEEEVKIEVSIDEISQNIEALSDSKYEFNYTIKVDGKEYDVTTDEEGTITSSKDAFSIDELNAIEEAISKRNPAASSDNKNNIIGYITSIVSSDDATTITARCTGFSGYVELVATVENSEITEITVVWNETQLVEGLEYAEASTSDLREIADGESVDIVSGVTYTSCALYGARRAIENYLQGGLN